MGSSLTGIGSVPVTGYTEILGKTVLDETELHVSAGSSSGDGNYVRLDVADVELYLTDENAIRLSELLQEAAR